MLSDACCLHVLKTIMSLYPNAGPTLDFQNSFELLVAVVLSAQTTDKQVNKVTPGLFQAFPTPKALAKGTPLEIETYINQIGLYHNKARYLHVLGKSLHEDFHDQVPKTRHQLMQLAGVGRKTANVVLSVAFNQPTLGVDTHITRIAKHHQLVQPDATVRQIEDRLISVLPPEDIFHVHHALIAFGREICTPKHPKCTNYPELYSCQEIRKDNLHG